MPFITFVFSCFVALQHWNSLSEMFQCIFRHTTVTWHACSEGKKPVIVQNHCFSCELLAACPPLPPSPPPWSSPSPMTFFLFTIRLYAQRPRSPALSARIPLSMPSIEMEIWGPPLLQLPVSLLHSPGKSQDVLRSGILLLMDSKHHKSLLGSRAS